MIEFDRILGFQWDAGNGRKSEDKHGVSQGEAEQVFFNNPLLVLVDRQHSAQEARFHALGKTDDNRPLLIAFILREDGTLIRIISARDMNKRERIIYDTSA